MIQSIEDAKKVIAEVENKCVEIADILEQAGLPAESGMFLGVLGLFLGGGEPKEKLLKFVFNMVEEQLQISGYKLPTIN